MGKSLFVISLDLELYWGVRDILSYNSYKENLDGAVLATEKILDMFSSMNIHATWAVVGLLDNVNIQEVQEKTNGIQVPYTNGDYSPFPIEEKINSTPDSVLFSPGLIQKIIDTDNQELATHTFSHYFCAEEGQGTDHFEQDLNLVLKQFRKRKIELKSIVFPRNQVQKEYIETAVKKGIVVYRGNPTKSYYTTKAFKSDSLIRKGSRWLDTFINVGGRNIYSLKSLQSSSEATNVPASFFLRPYSINPALQKLKLKRIKSSMEQAAKNNGLFHIWWHPHNFGKNLHNNMTQLEEIIDYYTELNTKYGFQSATMIEASQLINS